MGFHPVVKQMGHLVQNSAILRGIKKSIHFDFFKLFFKHLHPCQSWLNGAYIFPLYNDNETYCGRGDPGQL